MKVGYARTSTVEQAAGFEAQRRLLELAGCEKIFSEQVSSVAERQQLNTALEFVREGDVFTVTKLDRLARSMVNMMQIMDHLKKKGVELHILDLNLDTSTPTGQLILQLLGSVAQFERSIMLERQREGIAKAKAAGKFKGRKPTARAKSPEVHELRAQGVGASEIARRVGISRRSVYSIIGSSNGDEVA